MLLPRSFRPDGGRVLGRMFGSAILSLFGIGALVFGVWSHGRVKAANSWPTTQGVVGSSSITSSRSSKGRTTYRCKVAYSFMVNGVKYYGDKMDPLGNSGGSNSSAQEKLRKYPAGGPCTVHYDPADPTANCLELGSTVLSWIFTLIGMGMFVGGAFGLVKIFLPMGRVS